jgi:hypothetical protein
MTAGKIFSKQQSEIVKNKMIHDVSLDSISYKKQGSGFNSSCEQPAFDRAEQLYFSGCQATNELNSSKTSFVQNFRLKKFKLRDDKRRSNEIQVNSAEDHQRSSMECVSDFSNELTSQ